MLSQRVSAAGLADELTQGSSGPKRRALVVGVLNVTPDSFSDGGRWIDASAAVAHGRELLAQGADLLDVGGESTRPGAARVETHQELRRVVPVVRELAAGGAVVSVDTMRATVASACLDAGARVVNDVSGGLADPELPVVAAQAGVPYVVTHWRGHSDRMGELAHYHDVVAQVRDELQVRVEALLAAGLHPGQLVLDPGLGFAKAAEHDWALLAGLPQLVATGFPVLVGASRKRFLGRLLAGVDDVPPPPDERDHATAATSALAAAAGVWGVRVHAVPASSAAVRVAAAWGARGSADGVARG